METKQLGVRIPADLYRELQERSRRTGVSLTRLITESIRQHLAGAA